jgi:hypothetical protein
MMIVLLLYIVILTLEKHLSIIVKFMNKKPCDFGLPCPKMTFIRFIESTNTEFSFQYSFLSNIRNENPCIELWNNGAFS